MLSDPERFAQRYQNLIRLLTPIARLQPQTLSYRLAARVAQYASPYRLEMDTIRAGLHEALPAKPHAWRDFLGGNGIFVVNTLQLPSLNPAWIQAHVQFEAPAAVRALSDTRHGALLLTYHSHYQYLLFCVLGRLGLHPTVLTLAPHSSPLYPLLGDYMDLLHANTRRHFGHGDYLFIREGGSKAYQHVQNKLATMRENGGMLVCLNDNKDPRGAGYPLLTRHLPVRAGVIKAALALKIPIFISILPYTGGSRFVCRLRGPLAATDIDGVLRAYFELLAETVTRFPDVWEGWRWY